MSTAGKPLMHHSETTRHSEQHASARWLALEHEEIAHHLRMLERLFGEPARPAADIGLRDVRAWFHVVVPRLMRHFRHEKRAGFDPKFVEEYPRFARRIEGLRAEHRQILRVLGEC